MSSIVRLWTGHEAKALRAALRLTVQDFADRLGVSVRTVAKWEARGRDIQPKADTQAILDTALAQAPEEVSARFAAAVGESLTSRDTTTPPVQLAAAARDHPGGDQGQAAPTATSVMLPVVVDGRQILLPLDAAGVAGRGLALAMNLSQAPPGGSWLETKPASLERAYELYLRGQGLLATNDKRRVETATSLLNTALDIDPRFARAQAARGYAQWRQYFAGWASDGSTLQQALADVDSALLLEPDSIGAHTTLVRICWDMGWHERALEAGRSIYRKRSQSLEAMLAYARALNNAGLADLALPLVRGVLEIDSTNPTATKLLIWNHLMVGDYQAALNVARDYLPMNPSDSNTRWAVAVAHLSIGDLASATLTAEHAVSADADDVTVWTLLGYLHRIRGDGGAAVEVWSQGIEHVESHMAADQNPRIQSWLANVQAAAGQHDRARSTVDWLARTEPQNGYLRYRAAHVLAELGDVDGAIRLLSEAVRDGFRSIQLLRHEEKFALASLVSSEQYRNVAESIERRVARLRLSHRVDP
jgi:tetratricopeptide (TPR) repeat protein/transcriptional regulator with XRE-family HTH domain